MYGTHNEQQDYHSSQIYDVLVVVFSQFGTDKPNLIAHLWNVFVIAVLSPKLWVVRRTQKYVSAENDGS